MAHKFIPQLITANDLLEGDAIYFTKDDDWSREYSDSVIAQDAEQADQILARAVAQESQVVGPYLIDASIDDSGSPTPTHFREVFRTRGPSNYFHGKQEQA
ncbi:MAG: sulfite reductase [Hyphomicrobiales bacterium]|nr:MAG: sulfite reductase [Hyphomicrobiales bacterium]